MRNRYVALPMHYYSVAAAIQSYCKVFTFNDMGNRGGKMKINASNACNSSVKWIDNFFSSVRI